MLSRFLEYFKTTLWSPRPTLPSAEATPIEPVKFEPNRTNRWVLTIDGIDVFLIRDVKLPETYRGYGQSPQRGMMTVVLHEIEGTSNYKIISKLICDGIETPAVLKFLDTAGRVTETWTMDVIARSVKLSPLTYQHHDVVTVKARFSVETVTIEHP